ncbi:TonB-dependent receptor [Algihabitans albus]|uniref:TonB-dependent receptor domain-containing protein n=1 Tax=Algihabitans albus TaxID=2164067 RepID=UPI0035D0A0B0
MKTGRAKTQRARRRVSGRGCASRGRAVLFTTAAVAVVSMAAADFGTEARAGEWAGDRSEDWQQRLRQLEQSPRPAWAETAWRDWSPTELQLAQAQPAQRDFDIAAQGLTSALALFGQQSGLQVTLDGALARDRTTSGVQGSFTADQALQRLLAGTGLTYSRSGASIVVEEIVAAAAPPPQGPLLLDPLVVRGQLQIRTLQDTPESVAIQTGEELERRGDFDLYDAIERIPNVNQSPQERGFSIRGIDQRGPAAGGGGGSLVSTQVDGVALTNTGTFSGPFSAWDLQQVEVLRGPQSTQQGRNALAGAIVLRSNDPTYDLELRSRGEAGSRATLGGAVMANLPLIEDRLAVRFSADRLQTDGFVDNRTLDQDDFDAREQTTLRGKLRIDPTENLEIVASFSQTDSSRGENFIEEAFFPDDRVNLSNLEADEDSLHRNSGLRLTWRIDEAFSLESETNYYTLDYERVADRNRPAADDLGFLDRSSDETVFEQDLRLRYEGEDLSGVLGLFYTQTEEDFFNLTRDPASRFTNLAPPGVFLEAETNSKTEVENFAVFGEADIGVDWLLPGLTFTLGGRYDRETVDNDIRTVATLDPAIPSPIPLPNDRNETDASFSAFLPKIGLTYDWTPDIATSFTVQRGYRAGGAQVNGFTQQVNEFDPEFTWNYEFALRSQFFDRRLTANANLFYTDWTDQQVPVRGPSGNSEDFDIVNAGESRLYGAEASLEALVTPKLDVFGSIGLVQTEFLDFESGGRDFSGNEFRSAPEVTAAFGATYFFDNGISVGADASYTGVSFVDADNDPAARADARFLVNTQITYDQDRWNAGFFVRNLFDNDYATRRLPQQDGSRVLISGEPRTFGLYLGFAF